jgi:DNA-binding NtrC family response regulator
MPWRKLFAESSTAIYVIAGNGRVRYANPAWEAILGKPFAPLRGMKLPRKVTVDSLACRLAPPLEVWQGSAASVRRPAGTAEYGPPWWEIQFLPLASAEPSRPLAILGLLRVISEPEIPRQSLPAWLAAQRPRSRPLQIVGHSPPARRLRAQIAALASSRFPVTILGEPGTGKKCLAWIIHLASERSARPMITLDCLALEANLIESLVLGRGGAALLATAGSVVLQEPHRLPRDLQQRLLSVLQRSSAPRLFCTSQETLADLVLTERLVPEWDQLFSSHTIRMPTLRERAADLPELVVEYLGVECRYSDRTLAALAAYSWPGNLRELHQVLLSSAQRAGGGSLEPSHLPRILRERAMIAAMPARVSDSLGLDAILEQVEKQLLTRALQHRRGNAAEAAADLQITRARLLRRVEALGILLNGPLAGESA